MQRMNFILRLTYKLSHARPATLEKQNGPGHTCWLGRLVRRLLLHGRELLHTSRHTGTILDVPSNASIFEATERCSAFGSRPRLSSEGSRSGLSCASDNS